MSVILKYIMENNGYYSIIIIVGCLKRLYNLRIAHFQIFKPKWRIGFTNSINEIYLMDIKLLIISNDKPYFLLIGNDRFELNI
jgi:hypothetical protein